jgi:uncharacterized protein YjiS (DUF1127 family)
VRYLGMERERTMDGTRWIEREWQSPTPHLRWHALVECISRWRNRARQRRQLATLDDRMLADIGINRCDVMRECDKHFWEP